MLPRSAAATVGISGTGEWYRLEAFDGTASQSEAVRATLGFLGGRFRGRFLLIDAEIGVLGRDILNHVWLLLDGADLEPVAPDDRRCLTACSFRGLSSARPPRQPESTARDGSSPGREAKRI